MSELITYPKSYVYDQLGIKPRGNLYYLKYEADKYIGELKKERDWLAKDSGQAYDDLEKRAQLNIKQEESIRHQKYKRCLAMANAYKCSNCGEVLVLGESLFGRQFKIFCPKCKKMVWFKPKKDEA